MPSVAQESPYFCGFGAAVQAGIRLLSVVAAVRGPPGFRWNDGDDIREKGLLTRILEVDRNAIADNGLHLTHAPIGTVGQSYEIAGNEALGHG